MNAEPAPPPSLRDQSLYANRELSQLDFNFRVLAQAQDPSVPLLERLRFLCISCTNLDEFFEIRGGSVRHAIEFGLPPSADGLAPVTLLNRIHDRAAELVQAQYRCFYEGKDAFGREGHMAIVRAPRSLPRIIRLPDADGDGDDFHNFVFLSSVLSAFVHELFPGMKVNGAYQFRVTRNSELIVDEEDVDNLALALRDELLGRGYLRAGRLEIAEQCPQDIVDSLLANFELPANAVYKINGPVNLNRVVQVYDLVRRPDLKFPAFQPRLLRDVDAMFEQIRQGDVLLHHPYDAFAPVLELIRQAAEDPSVLAIKQTLYRAGKDSPIVEHLIQAARNGKDVTVVVELRARFDEEANLGLADRLQDAGVQVVYGVVGYKTHAKMLLIVRREGRELRRYVHLGTGNYHSGTARAYTDFSLMTANPEIGNDVHLIFQQLSGLAAPLKLRHLLQSPFTLHSGVLERIEREAAHARAGKPARIVAKMNALNETQVIRALYAASQAGVGIDLIVRGACTLLPGIEGVSANIRVRSIVGRFLEHHRTWWFGNDGAPELYCSSADWLERNLLRRVETAFPMLDAGAAQRVHREGLLNYLADNQNAWELHADGSYHKILPAPGEAGFSAQLSLLEGLYS